MGALHAGHLSLVQVARKHADHVVATIFVNPTQFGPNEDFKNYPRNEERDFELLRNEGVDTVFAPSLEEVYPRHSTTVHVAGVSERWEGQHRPNHFDGVATIVCKLFNIVRPNVALFGEKDFQQCTVIQRMVEDLNIPLKLIFCPTLREPDGLAMSSRNVYLNAEERKTAAQIYQTLLKTRDAILDQNEKGKSVDDILLLGRTNLETLGFKTDYFAYVDGSSLEPLSTFKPSGRLIVAAKIGRTRLIDNLRVS